MCERSVRECLMKHFQRLKEDETFIFLNAHQVFDEMMKMIFVKVVIPKLENLHIGYMDNLKEIWPCEFSSKLSSCSLRNIYVESCDSLVNLFPVNPMPFFNQLEELVLKWCDSLEVIFNIDLGCVDNIDQLSCTKLRSIYVGHLRKLRKVWMIKGENNSATANFDFRALVKYY